MNCEEYRERWIEVARRGGAVGPLPLDAAQHLDSCAECAQFLDRQREIEVALLEMTAEAMTMDVPAEVEANVLAAFDAVPRKRVVHARWWVSAAAGAVAASLVAGVLLDHRPAPPTPHDEAPFIEIPYVAPWAPYERAQVVRMDVPVAALVAAGLSVNVADTGAAVRADALVGQDGRIHAVRLISESITLSR